jgi:hypothetical protein
MALAVRHDSIEVATVEYAFKSLRVGTNSVLSDIREQMETAEITCSEFGS